MKDDTTYQRLFRQFDDELGAAVTKILLAEHEGATNIETFEILSHVLGNLAGVQVATICEIQGLPEIHRVLLGIAAAKRLQAGALTRLPRPDLPVDENFDFRSMLKP